MCEKSDTGFAYPTHHIKRETRDRLWVKYEKVNLTEEYVGEYLYGRERDFLKQSPNITRKVKTNEF